MAEICEQLRRLLDDPKLHKRLAESFGAGAGGDLEDDIRYAFSVRSDDELCDGDELPSLESIMQQMVVDRLPAPQPITAADLASIAISQLGGLPLSESIKNEDVVRGYQRLVAFALREIESLRETTPLDQIQIGEDWLIPADAHDFLPKERFDDFPEFDLWSSPSGFSLCSSVTAPWNGSSQVRATLKGRCSQLALDQAVAAIWELIESISMTAQWSATEKEFHFVEPFDLDIRYSTPIEFLKTGDGRRVLANSLSACFEDSSGKDELLNRLRNATLLLSHADQISAPIALSLSFAAIEALVCEKDELPVNKLIKRHVAALLIPDGESRKAKEKIIARLYDIRCNVLHGNNLDASSVAWEVVRILAAGVVRAIVCWRENQLRAGGISTWRELMDEVNAASRKNAEVVGVPDLTELVPTEMPD